jgi:hypothetical protein
MIFRNSVPWRLQDRADSEGPALDMDSVSSKCLTGVKDREPSPGVLSHTLRD